MATSVLRRRHPLRPSLASGLLLPSAPLGPLLGDHHPCPIPLPSGFLLADRRCQPLLVRHLRLRSDEAEDGTEDGRGQADQYNLAAGKVQIDQGFSGQDASRDCEDVHESIGSELN
uniref:Uncharacterized protein n=1 Tax=Oryza brachyantha TaxID=4533 RepID=J3LQJ5_ORYBR